ncbi:MAG: ATP-binding cassette domain-containing protein [Acidimicrobiales bacterium]
MNDFADWIRVEGARTHNLKNVDVDIPKGTLVAFTGVSGSGKSSLAIDTIHALSQQWYLEGLSPFVRKFLVSDDRPDVDSIRGLGASLAVDQQGSNNNPNSTVGSLVGAHHPLRLLYSRIPAFDTDPSDDVLTRQSTAFDPTHPDGQCATCLGVGGELEVDPNLVVAKPELSLLDGASDYAGKLRTRKGSTMELASIPALAKHFGADLATPWHELPETFRQAFLFGTNETIDVEIPGGGKHDDWSFNRNAPLVGAIAELERLHRDAKSESARKKYRAFFRLTPCEACAGTGVSEAARSVMINGWTYPEAANAVVDDLSAWAAEAPATLNELQAEIAAPLLREIDGRVGSLARLGLGHVTLARPVPTLSGGELQRVRLSSQLGSGLTGILYVLDEPSSGLHPNDRDQLVDVLVELRDRGNTVLLVEHDMDVVRRCDWVIDIGPGAGTHGGTVLASGPPEEVSKNSASVTGPFLKPGAGTTRRRPRRAEPDDWIQLDGITRNNVTNASVRFPLHRYTCIAGVSGSGKSTLLSATADAVATDITAGTTNIRWVEQVTQAPIGRNGRSNPATYTKLFDQIRKLFAATPETVRQGLDASSFSFNTDSGRCQECDGTGQLSIDMHYLPSITTTCRACKGRRFQDHILNITIDGLSIADVLDLTVEQALETPAMKAPAITEMLGHLIDVGLGYLTLGQPAPALSGGEAQRLKLARLLTKTTKTGTGLVVLDEPTAGLHPTDTARIIDVIESLVERGTTVLIADHQIATYNEADWTITTGPGAGPEGGQIVAQGPPTEAD